MLKHSKAQEKSNFAQTCNLLSQYMKEKGSLSLEMTRKPEPKGTAFFSLYYLHISFGLSYFSL